MYYALSYISNWECWSSKEIEMKLFEFHVAFNYFEDWRWIRIRDLWTNASRRVLCYISNWKSRSKSNNSSSFFNHFEDWRTRARYDICKCIALASFVTFLIENLDRNRIIRASSSFRTPLRLAKKRGIEKSPSKSNRSSSFFFRITLEQMQEEQGTIHIRKNSGIVWCPSTVDPRRPSPIVSTRRQWRFRNASSAKQWSFMRSRTRHNGRHSGSCVTIDILSGVLSTLLTSFDFTSFVHSQSIQIRTLFTSLLFLFSQSVVQRRKAKLE